MDQNRVLLIMIGMGIVTYLPRVIPLWFFASRELPPIVIEWLRNVPVAVLAAMLLPSILITDSQLHIALDNVFMWAAIPTLLVAWRTKSLFGSVIAGMLVVAIFRFLAG